MLCARCTHDLSCTHIHMFLIPVRKLARVTTVYNVCERGSLNGQLIFKQLELQGTHSIQ